MINLTLVRYRTTSGGIRQCWHAVDLMRKARGYGRSKRTARRDICADENRLRRHGTIKPADFEEAYTPPLPKKKTKKERR